MALTVDQAVAEVVGRLGGKLVWPGLAAPLSVVKDRTNPDVTPAVRDALRYFEVTPADYPAVIDADLATLPDPCRFLDAATLTTLYRIQGQIVGVDMKVGVNSQNLSQFAADVRAMIADYQGRVPNPNFPKGSVGSMASVPATPGYSGAVVYPPCNPFGVPDAVWPYRNGYGAGGGLY